RWNWPWPRHFQADRRNARWQHLGGVHIGAGLDFPYESACANRLSKISPMTKRILVVEDQDDLRGVLRDLFTTSGYVVIEATDGPAGIARAKSYRPSIILMDIQMPVIDGYEAPRQIKANPDLTSIPVVAISSFAMKGDEEKARQAGCDDYVTKPYS